MTLALALATAVTGGGSAGFNLASIPWRVRLNGSNVTTSGGKGVTLTDVTGNGFNFTQATAGLRSTFTASAINGMPALTGEAPAGYVPASNANIILAGTAATKVLVARSNPSSSTFPADQGWGTSGATCYLSFDAADIFDDFGSTVRHNITPIPSLTSPYVYIVQASATTWTASINGTQVASVAHTYAMNAGIPTVVGDASGGSLDLWAEEMWIDRLLTAAELAGTLSALRSKYAF